LSRENLYKELDRLYREDERFRQVLSTFQGRRLASQYQRELARLKAEKEQLERRLVEMELSSMSEEDVDRLKTENPQKLVWLEQKAREYGFDGSGEQKPQMDPQVLEDLVSLRQRVEETFERAELEGLSQQELNYLRALLAPGGCQNCRFSQQPHGILDHDAQGRWRGVGPDGKPVGLADYVADLYALVGTFIARSQVQRQQGSKQDAGAQPAQGQQQAAAAASAATPGQERQQQAQAPAQQRAQAPQPTRPRDSAAPDISPPGGGAATGQVWTMEELRKLPPPELLRLFPNPGDIERAIAEGRIKVNTGR
jgi:hypothetical protein